MAISGVPGRVVSHRLGEFPWDRLEPVRAHAAAHPDGLVDLSVGAPVDPVPAAVRAALAEAADAPGYPRTVGSSELRAALFSWLATTCGADTAALDVVPTVGSKECIATLPAALGLGPRDTVVVPQVCYPTYEVGARLVGARVVRADTPAEAPADAALVWLNSPGNPTGAMLSPDTLAAWLSWARATGAVLASDECYLTLGWEAAPTSALAVAGGRYDGVLALHSLSKRSNLAGYRVGSLAGDPALVGQLATLRKHAGAIVPAPVQAAAAAALADEHHAAEQRARYAARRTRLWQAFTAAGFQVAHSQAGLYLWLSAGTDCWDAAQWCAERGILVSPGEFYGPGGQRYVRAALTATDDRVAAAADRLVAASAEAAAR